MESPTHYNAVAARSTERLAALSDGVFAVAMTLLVLDLRPPAEAPAGEAELLRALGHLAPQLLVYMMSFLTLGIFWIGQQTQLSRLASSDRDLTWIHLAFLFAVTLMPFTTSFTAHFFGFRVAVGTYWLNIVLLGLLLFVGNRYAARTGHFRDDAGPSFAAAVERRIVVAQALYGVGAWLCVFGTVWSYAFIVLVQLNFALAPQFGVLRRI